MIPNKQPIEKPSMNEKGILSVHSIFFTLQGEGPFTGERAIFIRLAGCNLQCPACDTEYTAGRVNRTRIGMMRNVASICAKHEIAQVLVVITGGEPMRQNIAPLVFDLLQRGHIVQIESNGVLGPTPELELYLATNDVHLVISPKTSRINAVTARLATAYKYVLQRGEISADDGLPLRALMHKARGGVARPPIDWEGVVYVNPMDEHGTILTNRANLDACAASALKFGHRMGVQLHKLVDLE